MNNGPLEQSFPAQAAQDSDLTARRGHMGRLAFGPGLAVGTNCFN
jgi:hypothetical protein